MIWINGADGLLGRYLQFILKPYAGLICTSRKDLDITDEEKVKRFLKTNKFDVIIHCAAATDVDWCERHPEKAHFVNARAIQDIRLAMQPETIFVYLSTDYVFIDRSEESYLGTIGLAINDYGHSKAWGELQAEAINKHYIVRTSSLYGCGRPNFATKLWASGKYLVEPPQVVNDMLCSPTYAGDLALGIKDLIMKQPPFGVYHFTNQGLDTREQFARALFGTMGLKGSLPMRSVSIGGLCLSAQRPTKVKLPCEKWKAIGELPTDIGGITRFLSEVRDWNQGIKIYG